MKKVICLFLSVFLFFLLDGRVFATVTLSEFFPNPEGSDEQGEWIEIYNDEDSEVSLEGYTLSDAYGATTSYTFKQNDGSFQKIQSKSYLIIPKSASHITLNNDTEQVLLKSPIGVSEYSGIFSPVEEGFSLSRIGDDWKVSSPTPKAINETKTEIAKETEIYPTSTQTPSQNANQMTISSPSPSAMPTPTMFTQNPKPTMDTVVKKKPVLVSENNIMKESTSDSEINKYITPILLTKELEHVVNNEDKNQELKMSDHTHTYLMIFLGILFQILSCFFILLEWYNKRHEKRDKDSVIAIHASRDLDGSHISPFISK